MEIRTIHCPVDFSPISKRNVRMGVEMCKRIGSKLVLHHNLEDNPPGFLSVSWMWSEDHEQSVEDEAERRRVWDAAVLPYDQATFFGSADNSELLYVELTPTMASVHSGDPAAPPARWRRPPRH